MPKVRQSALPKAQPVIEAPEDLFNSVVAHYSRRGFRVTNRTSSQLQLFKPKRFSPLAAFLWFCLGGVGLVIYLLVYLFSSDQVLVFTREDILAGKAIPPAWKRYGPWASIVLAIIGISAYKENHSTQVTAAAPQALLSLREQALLDRMLENESLILARREDSLLKLQDIGLTDYISAQALARAYQANEVAADRMYRGRPVLVDGYIASISKDVAGRAFLNLYGTDGFSFVAAYMSPAELDGVASLRPGEPIALLCDGAGALMNNPILKRCQGAYHGILGVLKQQMAAEVAGQRQTPVFQKIIAKTKELAIRLPDTSSCWKDMGDPRCLRELEQIRAKRQK